MDMMITRHQGRTRRDERDLHLLKIIAVLVTDMLGHGLQ